MDTNRYLIKDFDEKAVHITGNNLKALRKKKKTVRYPPDRRIMPMAEYKEMLHYLSGIKILKDERKYYAGFTVCGEIYKINMMKFLILACYIGVALAYIQDKEKVKVPVNLVWQLCDFFGTQNRSVQLVNAHMNITEKAFHLLGYTPALTLREKHIIVVGHISEMVSRAEGDADKNFVRFNLRGEKRETFLRRLMPTIHGPLC